MGCQDILYTDPRFTEDSSKFTCPGAGDPAGYDGAFFMQGFIFAQDDVSGDDDNPFTNLVGVRCCHIPGTVPDGSSTGVKPEEGVGVSPFIKEEFAAGNSYEGLGMLERGGPHAWKGFKYYGLKDYDLVQSFPGDANFPRAFQKVGFPDYDLCRTKESNIGAQIDPLLFECGEGCDPLLTPSCETEYNDELSFGPLFIFYIFSFCFFALKI